MRLRDYRSDDEPEINLVPLIDVILVLIIFFVVTATFDARSVLKLQLPRATGEVSEDPPAMTILVNADGRYFVDDREVLGDDLESLKATISDLAGTNRDAAVMLRADARTPYQAVVTVYDALGQLGFRRIMSATAPPSDQTPADGTTR